MKDNLKFHTIKDTESEQNEQRRFFFLYPQFIVTLGSAYMSSKRKREQESEDYNNTVDQSN
jgi:hypothetical protein